MSDKATLLREADEAFAELRRAVEGLTDEEMRRVWLGTWGVREILIHISGWHEAMTPALGRIAKGEAPYPVGTYDDFDAWNARFVQERAGVKMPDVLAELDALIGLGAVKGKVFRIGHLGDFNDLTLAGTLAGVEMGFTLAGVPHKAGGMMAALEYLATAASQAKGERRAA